MTNYIAPKQRHTHTQSNTLHVDTDAEISDVELIC